MEKKMPKPPKKKISANLRQTVWLHNVGRRFEIPCLCCYSRNITIFDFHVGHIIAEAKHGSNEVSNLLPICASCNQSMHTRHLREYQKTCGYRQPWFFWICH